MLSLVCLRVLLESGGIYRGLLIKIARRLLIFKQLTVCSHGLELSFMVGATALFRVIWLLDEVV